MMAAEAAAPTTPTAAPQTAATDAAARDALIAELDADAGEESAPEPVESDDSEPEPSDDAEADESSEETGDEEAEEEPAFDSPDEFREHVKSLLEAGDMRKVEEALGLEKGALKINGAKLRYVQRTVADAQRKVAEAENLKESARNFYGPYVQAKQQFQSGTPQGVMQAARAVEGHFGVPLAVFVEHVLKAGKGEHGVPSVQQPQTNAEIEALKAQNAQILQLLQNQQNQGQAQAAEQRHIATISGKLKGTDLAKLKEGPQLVYAAIKNSYDANLRGYSLDLPKAIKAVLADPATKWRLHELKTKASNGKTAPAAVAPGKPGKQSPVKRSVVAAVPQTPAQKEAAERAALIAELEAEERREERAARRGKK
jgi:hypothetical protein